jgi:hypothetical protein
MDLTWRGVYSIARSNYCQAPAAEAAANGEGGPWLQVSTLQLRKTVVKVMLPSRALLIPHVSIRFLLQKWSL